MIMNQPYYVTLTGGKNNAGDFLIKRQAHALLRHLRPDREILDINGWEVSESKCLDLINNSQALLLTGGPAVVPNMVPNIYSIAGFIDKIAVPIYTYGLGWFHANGEFGDIGNFRFNTPTRQLLAKISQNGGFNSVRDYHTAMLLKRNGVDNTVMTGCPVLYNGGLLPECIRLPSDRPSIAFSLGVGFKDSRNIERQTKDMLMLLAERYGTANLCVVFHHSLEKHQYVATTLHRKQVEFTRWLDSLEINYVDISGSAQKLIDAYSEYDVHIGYRVHAHLFMLSQGRPSFLVAEDGRGTGQQQVLGEPAFRSYRYASNSKIFRGLQRFGIKVPNKLPMFMISRTLCDYVDHEVQLSYPKNKATLMQIELHFSSMRKFLERLP